MDIDPMDLERFDAYLRSKEQTARQRMDNAKARDDQFKDEEIAYHQGIRQTLEYWETEIVGGGGGSRDFVRRG